MCKALPNTLFLAPMCYEGEDPNAPVNDRALHATVGAKRLYALNQHIVTNGNPGYRLAKKSDSRRVHLRTIVYHRTKEEWVPLFTDFTKLLPVFGHRTEVENGKPLWLADRADALGLRYFLADTESGDGRCLAWTETT